MIEAQLTNKVINEKYNNIKYFVMKSDFLGAFAKWAVKQSPYDVPDLAKAMRAYNEFLSEKFDKEDKVICFTYSELNNYVSSEVFEMIPEIEILNSPKKFRGANLADSPDYDFIDLGALARNVFYDVCRDYIIGMDAEPKTHKPQGATSNKEFNSLLEIVEQLEMCNYSNIAGCLLDNTAFINLKERAEREQE